MTRSPLVIGLIVASLVPSMSAAAEGPPHPLLTWVKRHPRPDGDGRPSPRLGYEGSYGYDPASRLLIRHGGHNQGGGGEQNAETWTYDLDTDEWRLLHPNDAPPGVCCAQQNVFDDGLGRFVRFPAFSASHGWQSQREVWLKDSSVWMFDPNLGEWIDRRPIPAPKIRPLRGAAYDPHHGVIVVHGGEGASHGTLVYNPHANEWHEMHPEGGPEHSLSQPGFTYDAVNRVFVLFGSQFDDDPRTWLYDLEKNEWRVLETEIHPPSDKSSPILAADTRNGIVLASVKGAEGLETWALDVAKAEWKQLDAPFQPAQNDEGANGDRNRMLLYLPDRNLFVQEIRTKNEQQIWTLRYADAPAPLAQVRSLHIENPADGMVGLTWAPPTDEGAFRYIIERGTGEVPWNIQWTTIIRDHAMESFWDQDSAQGLASYYRVTATGENGRPGAVSPPVRSQPAVVEKLFVSAASPTEVALSWEWGATQGCAYHVERADVAVYSTDQLERIRKRLRPTSDLAVGRIRQIGPFRRLTDEPLEDAEFVDRTVDLAAGPVAEIAEPLWESNVSDEDLAEDGRPYRYAVYAYRVRAVNAAGVESGPSAAVFTFPSAVQNLVCREWQEEWAQLRWAASRESSVTGYLVYRHNGRYDSSEIVRLTPEPIDETTFMDRESGRDTRRYEVVAVDPLGQEGVPSQPVWSRREWQQFYEPYAGEWHQ